ncbi:hypothetical protein [Raoultella ornithinolytica]|uniref:hypothetical protein n=1 Tax=Raoultella ornithinolytica TaxID=54291 RepID=UPI0038506099
MNIKEIGDVFHCDCGFSWSRGKNGNHNCANGLREKVRQLAAENVGLKAAINAVNRTAEECEVNGDELKYVVEPSEFEALIDFLDETPATDRIVAGIKADGVEEFAAHLRANDNGASVCKMIAAGADDFAQQLREGADK